MGVALSVGLWAWPVVAEPVDTDGDGLTDFQEIHKYLTDPKKADSDGDGVPDGDWDERREYAYTIRTVLRFMPPFQDALNDDYQDARLREKRDDYIELEVVHYPLGTAGRSITPNPTWRRDYAGMTRYLEPDVTTNWNTDMQRRLVADLRAAGIHVDRLTDKEVVEKASTWLMRRSRYLSKAFTTYYIHYPNGSPTVYPGLEDDYKREFGRDSKRYDWTIDQHFDYELLGRGMYDNKTRGSCTSFAVYLTTALRAIGIPTRMIIAVSAVDGTDPHQRHLARIHLTHHQVRYTALRGIGAGWGFSAHTFNEVYVGHRWHRLNYNALGQPIVDENYLGLMTHLYTFTDLSKIDLARTWGWRYAKSGRCKTFRCSNPYTAVSISDQFGRHAKIPNPKVRRTPKRRSEPALVVMFPVSKGSSTWHKLAGEILRTAKGRFYGRTSRGHSELNYEEVLDESHGLYPGDVMVLLFSLDAPDRIPKRYEDLLPRPWAEIEAELKQGQSVELTGKARKLKVVLLAAPTITEVQTLIRKTPLLRLKAPAAPAVKPAAVRRPAPPKAREPKRHHKRLTISKAYWFDSKDRPDSIKRPSWMEAQDGHMLVHVDEQFEGETSVQYRSFYAKADRMFVLKSPGQPTVRATAKHGYWAQEFYIQIPRDEYAKMTPGRPHTIHPVNASSTRRWRVKPGVMIRKPIK